MTKPVVMLVWYLFIMQHYEFLYNLLVSKSCVSLSSSAQSSPLDPAPSPASLSAQTTAFPTQPHILFVRLFPYVHLNNVAGCCYRGHLLLRQKPNMDNRVLKSLKWINSDLLRWRERRIGDSKICNYISIQSPPTSRVYTALTQSEVCVYQCTEQRLSLLRLCICECAGSASHCITFSFHSASAVMVRSPGLKVMVLTNNGSMTSAQIPQQWRFLPGNHFYNGLVKIPQRDLLKEGNDPNECLLF